MDLRDWRVSKGMTLAQLAPILDMPVSSLSDLERGVGDVSRKTTARIDGATGGAVTVADLWAAWRAHNKPTYSEHRAAGRGAMQAFRTAAKKPRK